MAITFHHSGATVKKISSVDGSVEIGAKSFDTYDSDGNRIINADKTGFDTYDASGKNMLHSGYDPYGSDGITAVARQGQDAMDSL